MSDEANNTRREWMSRVAYTAGALATLEGCRSGQSPQTEAEKAKLSGLAQNLQVICHGMMAFRLRKNVSPPKIRIYIPQVMGHAYGAGNAIRGFVGLMDGPYQLAGPTAAGDAPATITANDNVLLTYKSGTCECGLDNATSLAYIDIPMPDAYKGFRPVRRTAGSGPFFKGNAATGCSVNPATYFAVHVFRYNFTGTAQFVTPSGNSVWDTQTGPRKLHIYAEPPFQMPDRLAHIKELDKLFDHIDLEFVDDQIATDPPGGDGSLIDASDTESLSDKVGRGGDPTTCVSFFANP